VKCFINNQIVLSRAPEGPLAPHIGPFARSLSEQGYTLNSIQRQVLLAACFSRWLKQQGVALCSITSDHPPRYLRYRARRVRPSLGDAAALRRLLDFLRCEGVIPVEKISVSPLTPAERCTRAFEHHLREARGLASATIANYLPFIRGFLEGRFGQDSEKRLPLLSTYLGHVHVADTQWYLEGSPELMREAMQRLQQRWEDRP